MPHNPLSADYVRLPQILGPNGICPVARSTFYALIAQGKLPRPVKLGRVSLWRLAELLAAIEENAK